MLSDVAFWSSMESSTYVWLHTWLSKKFHVVSVPELSYFHPYKVLAYKVNAKLQLLQYSYLIVTAFINGVQFEELSQKKVQSILRNAKYGELSDLTEDESKDVSLAKDGLKWWHNLAACHLDLALFQSPAQLFFVQPKMAQAWERG